MPCTLLYWYNGKLPNTTTSQNYDPEIKTSSGGGRSMKPHMLWRERERRNSSKPKKGELINLWGSEPNPQKGEHRKGNQSAAKTLNKFFFFLN